MGAPGGRPSPSELVLHVADLRRSPGSRRPVELEAVLDDLAVTGSAVPVGAPVRARLVLESVPDGIVVTGSVAAAWEGSCRRCLGPATGEVRVPVREIYEPHPVEGETWPLEADRVDVEPVVREAVLLELPMVPLCREDCAGICPQCGVDRNAAGCDCRVEVRDDRWAPLDELRFDDDPAAGGGDELGTGDDDR
jgi:uncharacterized protein